MVLIESFSAYGRPNMSYLPMGARRHFFRVLFCFSCISSFLASLASASPSMVLLFLNIDWEVHSNLEVFCGLFRGMYISNGARAF